MFNQAGDKVNETVIQWASQLNEDILKEVILLLIDYLKSELVITNATKNGNTQLTIRPKE